MQEREDSTVAKISDDMEESLSGLVAGRVPAGLFLTFHDTVFVHLLCPAHWLLEIKI